MSKFNFNDRVVITKGPYMSIVGEIVCVTPSPVMSGSASYKVKPFYRSDSTEKDIEVSEENLTLLNEAGRIDATVNSIDLQAYLTQSQIENLIANLVEKNINERIENALKTRSACGAKSPVDYMIERACEKYVDSFEFTENHKKKFDKLMEESVKDGYDPDDKDGIYDFKYRLHYALVHIVEEYIKAHPDEMYNKLHDTIENAIDSITSTKMAEAVRRVFNVENIIDVIIKEKQNKD